MLVISRKRDETIVIGDSIEVTVVEIRGDKVRIGITCPADTAVHRREVYDAIQRTPNLWAASAPTSSSSVATSAPVAVVAEVAAEPATLKLSAKGVKRLDKLRATSELSRETAMETLLEVVDQAKVESLCDLEKRLDP